MGIFVNNLLRDHTTVDECYTKTLKNHPDTLKKLARMLEAKFAIVRLCDDGWKAHEFIKKQKTAQCNNKKSNQNHQEDLAREDTGGTKIERKPGRPPNVSVFLSMNVVC
jgi:hypothetical protein